MDSQTPKRNYAQNVHEMCPLINQTLVTSTDANNVCEYETKLSALRSYVQSELSTLYEKIDCLVEKFNPSSNIEPKPYKFLLENIEFLQNEFRSQDKMIIILMETQTAVLQKFPIGKPHQHADNTLFHNSTQCNADQLNQHITLTKRTNQQLNRPSQHHITPPQSISNNALTNSNKNLAIIKSSKLEILTRNKNKTLWNFFVLTQLHTCKKNVKLNNRLVKMVKAKVLVLQ